MLTNRGTITPMNPPREFNIEFSAWRKGRPQWRQMLAGIKRGLPLPELIGLAAEAGLTNVSDLHALIELRARAIGHQAEAQRLPAAQKAAAALDKQWFDLDQKLNSAGTRGEEDRIECEMLNMADTRQAAHQTLTSAEYAADQVAVAKAEGVL